MAKSEAVEAEANVLENCSNGMFKVELDNGHSLIAHLSGKMRISSITLTPGDRVNVAMSPYDLSKGRIIRRLT